MDARNLGRMAAAETVTGNGHTIEALPVDKTVELLRSYRAIR